MRSSRASSNCVTKPVTPKIDSYKDVREIDVLQDKRSEDPSHTAHRKAIKDLLTRELSRTERLIVVLYYFEEMTMREIGHTLDLSESRLSQIHSGILQRLRHEHHGSVV